MISGKNSLNNNEFTQIKHCPLVKLGRRSPPSTRCTNNNNNNNDSTNQQLDESNIIFKSLSLTANTNNEYPNQRHRCCLRGVCDNNINDDFNQQQPQFERFNCSSSQSSHRRRFHHSTNKYLQQQQQQECYSPSFDQGYHTLISQSPSVSLLVSQSPTSTTQQQQHHQQHLNQQQHHMYLLHNKKQSTSTTYQHYHYQQQHYHNNNSYYYNYYNNTTLLDGVSPTTIARSTPLTITMLTDTLLLKIFKWLNTIDLYECTNVCKRFEYVICKTIITSSSLQQQQLNNTTSNTNINNHSLWRVIQIKGTNINADYILHNILCKLYKFNNNHIVYENMPTMNNNNNNNNNSNCYICKNYRCYLNRTITAYDTNDFINIERIFISDGARLTDVGLYMLTQCVSTTLTHLQVQGCSSITNHILYEFIHKCVHLQHLDISGCTKISTFTTLSTPQQAQTTIQQAQISSTAIESTSTDRCSSLSYDNSTNDHNHNSNSGGNNGDNMVASLTLTGFNSKKFQLQYLDLTDCSSIDDYGLRTIVIHCPQLIYLYLRRCLQITDAGIKCVPSFCSALRELSVSDCTNLTDFGLYELAKLGATLRYLSVAKCDRVSDPGLKVIVRRCYKLRYLNCRGCEAVSDDAITILARSCSRLRALDIGKCDVTDNGLRQLAESCPNLKKLSLRNCELITDKGIQYIAYYCRGLQLLNIQDCQITIDGYRAVKKFCKRCVIEHTNPGFF